MNHYLMELATTLLADATENLASPLDRNSQEELLAIKALVIAINFYQHEKYDEIELLDAIREVLVLF